MSVCDGGMIIRVRKKEKAAKKMSEQVENERCELKVAFDFFFFDRFL